MKCAFPTRPLTEYRLTVSQSAYSFLSLDFAFPARLEQGDHSDLCGPPGNVRQQIGSLANCALGATRAHEPVGTLDCQDVRHPCITRRFLLASNKLSNSQAVTFFFPDLVEALRNTITAARV